MKLSDIQNEFMMDVSVLIQYIQTIKGYKCTGGELYRTMDQQRIHLRNGKSTTLRSSHLQRLAIDLNIFINGRLTYKKEDLQEIGEFWENLRPGKNIWGGNWKSFIDTPHFERRK